MTYYPHKITPTDPGLAHQIVLRFMSGRIAVSCNCLRRKHPTTPTGGGAAYYLPLDVRVCWQPGEAEQVWREHVEREAA